MNPMSALRVLSLASALSLALSTQLMAQSTSSAISGDVTGSDSKPLIGATVTITHVESGLVRTVITDANGHYLVHGLPVGGPYSVVAIKNDDKQSKDGVYLPLAETKYIDLIVGDVPVIDTVLVEGVALGADIFSRDKMGVGTNITEEQLTAYPSINRNIQDFARLDPRVVQTDKALNKLSVSGLNPRYNSIRVDGVSISDTFGLETNNMPTPRQPLSMEVIQGLNVDVASYDVTVTGGIGAVITAVTKSGTNDFTGSVYGMYRENDWSGKGENNVRADLFNNETTYGFTFGGPIVKDKLFFFANYEKFTGTDEF